MQSEVCTLTSGTATVKLILQSKNEGDVQISTSLEFSGCFIKNDDNLQYFVEKFINNSDDRNKLNRINSKYVFYTPVGYSGGVVTEAVITYEEISTKLNVAHQKTKTCTVKKPLVVTFDGHFFLFCDSKDLNKSKFIKEYSKGIRIHQTMNTNQNVYGLGIDEGQLKFILLNLSQDQSRNNIYTINGTGIYEKLKNPGPLVLLLDDNKTKTLVGYYRKRTDGNNRIEIDMFEKSQGDPPQHLPPVPPERDRAPDLPPVPPERDRAPDLPPVPPERDRAPDLLPPSPRDGNPEPVPFPVGHPERDNRQLETEAEAEAETETTAPPEILASSPEALEAYKEALMRGKTKNRRVLVTIVGPPRAGKTSLLKSLKGEDFNPNEDSTTGDVLQNSRLEEVDGKDDPSMIPSDECMAEKFKDVAAREHPSQKNPEDEKQEFEDSVMENTSLKLSILNYGSKVPNEMVHLLDKRLRDTKNDQRANENAISFKTLDFAGQQVYEVILPLFISSKSIYLLVHSLENDLRSDAQPKVKHGNSERKLKNPFQMTYLDAQEFWLSYISSYTTLKKEVDSVDYRTQVALPPVFVVCTHADVCIQDAKEVARELCKILTRPENPFGKHVVPTVYTVNNKLSDNKEVQDEYAKRLKMDVEELTKLLPQVNEDIPISWLRFEEELSRLVEKEQKKYVNLEEAMRIATQCNVNTATESIEFTTLLKYLHDLKTIIYFEETRTVFIDTQWLVDMFVKVITVLPFEEWKAYAAYWRKLENDGILQRALVEHVWSDIASDGQNTVDNLLLIMEKFSLICPWRLNEEDVYLVPCMLRNSKGTEDIEKLLADQKSSTMLIRFKSVHLPMGIFPRLFVALAEHGKKEWPKVSQGKKECLPKLRRNFCRMFNVGQEGNLDICLTSGVRTICVTVYNKKNIDGASVTKFCQSLRKLLDKIFAAMENTCPRVENMELEYGIRCSVCTKLECSSHETKGCKRDSCQHFVSEKELKLGEAECREDETNTNTLIREETYSHWFPKPNNKRSHVQVETQQLERNSHGNGATGGIPKRQQKMERSNLHTPSEKELNKLAGEIITIWKSLGRELGVRNSKIEDILRDNTNYAEIREKAFQMLLFWKESSQNPSYRTLGNALIELEMLDLARRYCDM